MKILFDFRILTTIILLLSLNSCETDDESVNNDKPMDFIPEVEVSGKLKKFSIKDWGAEFSHHFDYGLNNMTDYDGNLNSARYKEYTFEDDRLIRIIFNYDVSGKVDSSIFEYFDGKIARSDYISDIGIIRSEYYISDNLITYSKHWDYRDENNLDSCYYQWSNGKLDKFFKYDFQNNVIVNNLTFSFEYSSYENPFLRTNIPELNEIFDLRYDDHEMSDFFQYIFNFALSKVIINENGTIETRYFNHSVNSINQIEKTELKYSFNSVNYQLDYLYNYYD